MESPGCESLRICGSYIVGPAEPFITWIAHGVGQMLGMEYGNIGFAPNPTVHFLALSFHFLLYAAYFFLFGFTWGLIVQLVMKFCGRPAPEMPRGGGD